MSFLTGSRPAFLANRDICVFAARVVRGRRCFGYSSPVGLIRIGIIATAVALGSGGLAGVAAADSISAPGVPVEHVSEWSAPRSLPSAVQPVGPVTRLFAAGPDGLMALATDGTSLSTALHPAGADWQAPGPVPYAVGACVAPNRGGDVIAVWADGKDLRSTFRPAGGTWQPVVRFAYGDINNRELACVLEDNGDAHAVFQRGVYGNQNNWYVSALAPGGRWTTPLLILGSDARTPALAADPAGNVILAAASGGSPGDPRESLLIKKKPANGPWRTNSSTFLGSSSRNLTLSGIVTNANGQTVIGWGASSGSSPTIKHSAIVTTSDRFDGSWVSTSFASSYFSVVPTVALDDTGTVAAVWADRSAAPSTLTHVEAAVGPLGGPLDTSLLMSVPSASALPRIAVGGGVATAVWNRTSDNAIVAARRPTGGPWAVPTVIGPAGSGGTTMVSAVHADPDGSAVAAWAKSTAVQSQLSYFDQTAPQLTATASTGSTTTGSTVSFSAAASDRWSTANVSWDFGDGSTGSGSQVSRSFSAPGSYPVVATASDAAGNRSRATLTVRVVAPSPTPKDPVPTPTPQDPSVPVPIPQPPSAPTGPGTSEPGGSPNSPPAAGGSTKQKSKGSACVLPRKLRGARLPDVRRRLAAAGCGKVKVVRARSKSVRRDRVVSAVLHRSTGRVTVTVSLGPPRRAVRR